MTSALKKLLRLGKSKNPGAASSEAQGGALAFSAIYEEHYRTVWRTLRRLRVAESELVDATQDVFVVVYRRLDEFEGRSQLRTWIIGICRRVASDYRRRPRAQREVVTAAGEIERLVDTGSAGGVGEHQQRAELARALLDRLPEAQREVFILFELEQLSGEEIAALLGIPVGTVRSRLRRARDAFRREVGEALALRDREAG